MTLEISLHPPFVFPRVLRAQKDDSRQHWLGQAPPSPQTRTEEGKQNNNRRQKKEGNQGYRPLADIKPGEVKDAFDHFEPQLIPVYENYIAENHFCTITLKRIRDGRPSMIFGRVKVCLPSDGYIDNIEDVELLFPRNNEAPDKVRIYRDDISQYSQRSALSYHVRVRFKVSGEDAVDFARTESLFNLNGFHPEFESGLYDLLEMNAQNQSAYPWMYVISSRWFNSIPESLYPEIKTKLKEMLQWGKYIFNYHPDWLPKEINTLNQVLGLKYEFTPILLAEPANPQDTAFIVQKIFDRDIFLTSK